MAVNFESRGISSFEHNHYLRVFGSFSVVLGAGHNLLMFSWDGREFFLDTSRSSFRSAGDPPDWRPFRNTRIPDSIGLFDEIGAQTREVFAIQ